jgi:tetratricopeptide (TPR) repeat protein
MARADVGIRSRDDFLVSLDRLRVDQAIPRELGIHSAIPMVGSDDDLPTYVEREFDFQLRTALATNLPDRGSFVVMVGGSSTGKTRSLYEAIYQLVPEWGLVQPADASELLDVKNAPPRETVFWLDELQQYLGGHPPLTAECVRALVRHGNLVVGTLWPDQYAKWTAGREDVHLLVKSAFVIPVPDALNADELSKAEVIAEQDTRIRDALEAREVGLTQVLAGGPRLVMCWEQPANAYAKALITAAADAHRLGVQAPLSVELLTGAMFGYLRTHQRVRPTAHWMSEALPHATEPLYGDVSPLFPVDDGRAGTLAGYTIADYLAQHVRRKRRTEAVPHHAWQSLVTHLRQPQDLRRLATSALARLRYCYAEPALTRLVDEFDDGRAAAELVDLLVRQDRLEEAVDVLHRQLGAHPHDRLAVRKLAHVQELWQRVDEVRPPPGRRARDIPAAVADILADGGVCDELRREAEAGDTIAAERLVERLTERGCLREIRDRAERNEVRAAEALADLYLAWGEVELLRERADAGDRAAGLRLAKIHRLSARRAGAVYQIAELRSAVDEGRPEAALQLCTLLFELRDEKNLKAELNAGTTGAAERLIALYTAQEHRSLIQLRAFGLDADGQLVTPGTDPLNVRGKDH